MSASSIALLLAIPTLWAGVRVWMPAVGGLVVGGYAAGVLHGPAALWLLVLAGCAWSLRSASGASRAAWFALSAGVSLLLGVHLLPGFSNPVVVRDAILAHDGAPYTQYVNFDKTLGGLLLLGCAGWVPMRSRQEWRNAVVSGAPWTLVTVTLVMAVSLALGFVRFDPRWTSVFWVWAPVNLLTTCVSEEAFFRFLVQIGIHKALGSRRHAAAWSVAASGLLFGVAHAAGGWRYVVLASMAGIGYAYVYQRTGRLEMSILTHFALNTVHFVFFTYPALAGALARAGA